MKNISLQIMAAVAALSLFAGPAAALEVSCPVDQVRTEVTTPLPDGWWQTPQSGSLQNTRIGEVGGEPTLICEYWAYGDTVSVMRRVPGDHPNCTANDIGFTCNRNLIATPLPIPIPLPDGIFTPTPTPTPAESPSTTYRTGSLSIPQTWQADFDTGEVGSGTADIWFHAITATERYIEPRNGAQIGIYGGGSGISKSDCEATPKSGNRIPVGSAPEGTYICYLTSDGRHGLFRVNAPIGASPGTMEIGFTTWE